jgi:hypothetical protein
VQGPGFDPQRHKKEKQNKSPVVLKETEIECELFIVNTGLKTSRTKAFRVPRTT